DVEAPYPGRHGFVGSLRHVGQPLVSALAGDLVAVPEGEVKCALHLLSRAVNENIEGLRKAQIMHDVEELVGRQGANGADRIGRGEHRVGTPAATAAVELGAGAG